MGELLSLILGILFFPITLLGSWVVVHPQEEKVILEPSDFHITEIYGMRSYYGNDPYDDYPTLSDLKNYAVKEGSIEVKLPPVSLNLVRIKPNLL